MGSGEVKSLRLKVSGRGKSVGGTRTNTERIFDRINWINRMEIRKKVRYEAP